MIITPIVTVLQGSICKVLMKYICKDVMVVIECF